MNAKDKANELVEKFSAVESLKDYEGMDFQLAKECALITVKQIWNVLPDKTSYEHGVLGFWNEVKKQIELL